MAANNPSAIRRLNKVLAAMTPEPRSVKSAARRRLSAILDVNQTELRIYLRASVAPPPAPKPVQLGRLDRLVDRYRRDPVRAGLKPTNITR